MFLFGHTDIYDVRQAKVKKKTPRGRPVDFSVGTFLPYAGHRAYVRGAAIALTSSVILVCLSRLKTQDSLSLDSQRWTTSSSKGTFAFLVVFSSCLFDYRLVDLKTLTLDLIYFFVIGVDPYRELLLCRFIVVARDGSQIVLEVEADT
jgi:hypothetical protein